MTKSIIVLALAAAFAVPAMAQTAEPAAPAAPAATGPHTFTGNVGVAVSYTHLDVYKRQT